MKLRNKLKVVGAVAVATGLTALMLHDNPKSWTISAKVHEPLRTYAEQTIYPAGDFFVFANTGRIMADDEDFKIKLSRKTWIMGRNPMVIYSEREVKVSEETYGSVQVGESGVYTLKNKIEDTDVPTKWTIEN